MHSKKNAYLLVEAMIAIVIAGVVATIFTTMSYYTSIQANLLKQQNTKTILEVVRSRLVNLAKDVDDDSYFELPKEDANNNLPVDIGLGVDAWAKKIYYYTYDFGIKNTIDSDYADTNDSISPNSNIAGRLVSSGQDMVLDTNASHSTAQNDDLMLEIGIGELNHFKLYGSSEITTQTRGYNSAIVSDTQPTSPINGTLWYDTNNTKLKMYDKPNDTWIDL
ncbi:MAG: type II secretion system protein [Campylobacterota bacterium]|nr:type II secretion system protein [Campylobacterota bacterium]